MNNLGNVAGIVISDNPPLEADGVTEKRYVWWARPVNVIGTAPIGQSAQNGTDFVLLYWNYQLGEWVSVSAQGLIDDSDSPSSILTFSKTKILALLQAIQMPVYDSDITVALGGGKNIGPYVNGDVIPRSGKTMEEFLDMLVTEIILPTLTAPSVSVAMAITGVQEVGLPYSAKMTATFNRGKISGKIVGGVWQAGELQDYRAGDAVEYTLDGAAPQASNNKIVTRTLTLGSNTFDAEVSYAAGPQPVNSTGGDYSTPLAAGTVTGSTTIVARKVQFHGGVTSNPATSAAVRALANKVFDTVNSFVATIDTKKYTIAIPATKSLVSVITANNENITSNFVEATFNVSDAGSGSSSYKVYTLTTAVPLNLTANVILT